MKPRFIEIIKLGVLVAMIALALAVVLHGPADAQDALRSFSNEGVSGWFSTSLMLMKWLAYAFIVMVFACAACLVLSAFGILTWIVQRMASGLAWLAGSVRSAWVPPPLPIDTVIETSRSGAPITLGQVLKASSGAISQLKAEVRALKELTSGLEPPPPPKSPEELLAERDEKMAAMEAELRKLRAAASRKTVAQPAVPAAEAKA